MSALQLANRIDLEGAASGRKVEDDLSDLLRLNRVCSSAMRPLSYPHLGGPTRLRQARK